MEGPLGLADYLDDTWLRGRTGTPPLGRDPAAERAAARRYLDEQPAAWLALVRSWADVLPPLSPDHRLVVYLPAGNEAQLIAPCLSALAADIVSSHLQRHVEIVVVHQHCAGETVDETADRVRQWSAADRDEVVVHLIEVQWPAGCTTFLALSRKLAVDVVAERVVRADRRAPLYLMTEDADVEWVERGRAAHVVQTFDADPRCDALRGWHLRTLDLLEYLPLFVERATWRACEHALADPRLRPGRTPRYEFAWNRVVTAGWNVAITLEAYLLAGGYTPTVQLFEDMDIGQRISVMRGHFTDSRFVPATETATWMPFEASSDGRRALAALVEGTDLYGVAPTLPEFVDATAKARTWSLGEAIAVARCPPPADAVERVWQRRRREVAGMVADDHALALVMAAVAAEMGVDRVDVAGLRARQRAFLAAARSVASGADSATHAAVLRRSGTGS